MAFAGCSPIYNWASPKYYRRVYVQLLDIYVCYSRDEIAEKRANQLFINNGNLTFTNKAKEMGVADIGYTTNAAFFDYDKDGDLDIFCISTLNYNGFDINVFENKGNNAFTDVTKQIIDDYSDKISFPNFYNIRFYDVDKDGDYDMVPDQIANWGGIKYSSNMFWENNNGKFTRKNK
jgi:hypothetical protein